MQHILRLIQRHIFFFSFMVQYAYYIEQYNLCVTFSYHIL